MRASPDMFLWSYGFVNLQEASSKMSLRIFANRDASWQEGLQDKLVGVVGVPVFWEKDGGWGGPGDGKMQLEGSKVEKGSKAMPENVLPSRVIWNLPWGRKNDNSG